MSANSPNPDLLEKPVPHSDEEYDYRSGYDEGAPAVVMREEDVDIKSDEVREVMGNPPHWIIRSGIMMIAIVTLLLLTASYAVRYPDTLATEVTIATEAIPTSVKARQSGKLTHLFVQEHQSVVEGEYLGILENTIEYEAIRPVRKWFFEFWDQLNKKQKIIPFYTDSIPELGTMQASFAGLKKAHNDYRLYLEQDANQLKVDQLRRQILVQEQLRESIEQKIAVNRQTFALTEKKYLADKGLFEEGVISEQEYDNAEKNYLNEKLTLANTSNDLASQQLQIESLKQQIVELEQQTIERIVALKDAIRQAAITFHTQLIQWEENYVLKAPIKGNVSFYKFWTQNQEVQSGDEVMVVIPSSDQLFAYSYLPAANSGKVKEGQKVRIELKDFPFQEYGYVYGVVTAKSNISREGKYLLRIDMPNGLMTKYGESLPFSQEMTGTANIITEDLRLLERFFKNFRGTMEQFL
ncbi:HlyD family efflux transporter periplasmic adaptor subunit [Roseivirga sp. BDSF3-8]|uniref:HlyD family efflux transporter periplasmic adaptor subunit n=1 Tax=Roseivirga sp. BDSF3-8 TaxID=3241598 RepID=UPI0035318776